MKKLDIEYDLVVIIDCLSEAERSEFDDSHKLATFLADRGFKQLTAKCANKISVLHALKEVFLKQAKEGKKFTINFISHGTETSLLIKHTNEQIDWPELRPYLREINKAMGGGLVVNMSCCQGFYGYKIDERDSADEAFFGVVGPTRRIKPVESIQANEIYYNSMSTGMEVPAAVEEINKALGPGSFRCIAAQENKL